MTNPPFIACAPLRRVPSVPLLRGQQELVESLQLLVAVELDLDPTALPLPGDTHLGGQGPRQPVGGRRDVRIDGGGADRRGSTSLPASLAAPRRHPLLRFPD